MKFLPIVARELRVSARRRRTFWTRFFAALTVLASCTWVWWVTEDRPAHARGEILFRFVSGLALVYSILAGIGITSDTISEEKREGTLGLLFLTNLAGYDVVLGKLAATSLNAVYRLFSIFPILAIPLLLGALTLSEFWRMSLVLTNTLFFSLTAGMFISAVSIHERRAMTGTFLLIFGIAVAPAIIGWAWSLSHKSAFNVNWLLSSMVYPAVLAFDAPYKLHPRQFWTSVVITHVLSWFFLAAASFLVRRIWQDRAAVGLRSRWQNLWRTWRFGTGDSRTRLRHRLLDVNPMLWLSGRNRLKQIYVLLMLAALASVWGWLAWKYPSAMFDSSIYLLTAYVAHFCLKIWVASEAARLFGDDRRTGALELVLSTPQTVDSIIDGQIRALERQFTWPVALVLSVDLFMLIAGSADQVLDGSSTLVLVSVGLMIMLVADLYTLAFVGLWLGLVSKSANRAFGGVVGRILVLPWVVYVLGLTWLATGRWRFAEPGEAGLLAAAFILHILWDAVFFIWAKRNLKRRFRAAATHGIDSVTPAALLAPATAETPLTVPEPSDAKP